MTAVATGVSLDTTCLMNPQCAITTLEEQIVARKVTQDIVPTPGDTGDSTPGGHANAKSFALAIATTKARSVSSMPVKTLTISGQVHGYLFSASGPMASAYVSIAAAAGGNNMNPRPYEVVKRHWPGAQNKYWHSNEVLILAEIRSTTSPVFWPRPDRQLLRYSSRDQIDNFSGIVVEISS